MRLISDWNGVWIADMHACMAADNHVIETFGGRPVDLKVYRATISIPAIEFYVLHGCSRERLESDTRRVGEVFHAFYEPRAAKCRTCKGARALLAYARSTGLPIDILSNHTITGIEAQLARLGIRECFSTLIANHAGDTSMKSRNKLSRLQDYIETSRIDPKVSLIVGDSPEEVEIGERLGLKTIAITDGYYSTDRLRASQPDYLIHSLADLVPILERQ